VSSMIAEDLNLPHDVQSLWLMAWGQFTDHDLSHTALSKDVLHPSGTKQPTCHSLVVGYGACVSGRSQSVAYEGRLCINW